MAEGIRILFLMIKCSEAHRFTDSSTHCPVCQTYLPDHPLFRRKTNKNQSPVAPLEIYKQTENYPHGNFPAPTLGSTAYLYHRALIKHTVLVDSL